MSQHESENPQTKRSGGRVQLAAAGLFVLINLAVPVFYEDLYPFTRGPMFCDQPRQYCNYYVYAPDGSELPTEDFLLQRVYDGNPPGLGVGIQHRPTLDVFGQVPDEATVRAHVKTQLTRIARWPYVDVVQEVVGAKGSTVGVVNRNQLRVHRSDNGR